MPADENFYEVCFTVSPDNRTGQITFVKPDHIFYGNTSEDQVFKVKANSEEDAEDQARKLLTDPGREYIRKYGPGFEVKTKYIRKVIYL
jgi:hypothetical protein